MNKWIKWISLAVVLVLSVAAVTGAALAQGPVDEDGDGVCDECGRAVGEGLMRGRRFSDGETWMGYGRQMNGCSFVDEDGDGVCDDCDAWAGQSRRFNQDGELLRSRKMTGEAGCENFVDEDGDGVCDNCQNGTGAQTGQRLGGRGAAGRGRSN